VVSCAKAAELIEMPFGTWTQVGTRKHVLGRGHTGATWQIPLNRPCVAVMRPVVKLLWPLVYYCSVFDWPRFRWKVVIKWKWWWLL